MVVESSKPKYCDDAATWSQWAESTYQGARTLFRSGNPFLWFPAAILGHQAIEMYLKAALIKHGHQVRKEDVWGHDLPSLLRLLSDKVSNTSAHLRETVRVFNDYFNELRYPSELLKVAGLGEREADLLDGIVVDLQSFLSFDGARRNEVDYK